MHLEARALNQTTIIGNRSKRLNGHSIPHQLRIIGGQLFIGDPICKSQPAVLFKNPTCLRESLLWIGHMAKRFLADDGIHSRIVERNTHYTAFDDSRLFLTSAQLSQLLRTCDERQSQFAAYDVGSIFVCEISDSATKSCAKICHLRRFSNLSSSR